MMTVLFTSTDEVRWDSRAPERPDLDQIVTVRPESSFQSKQGLPTFVGVSGSSAGTRHLSLQKVVIPPGVTAQAHYHEGFETAIYLLHGSVLTRFGQDLEHEVLNVAGDFLFIPPDVPHEPRNVSNTETAIALVTRNDPNEQESVVLVPGSGV